MAMGLGCSLGVYSSNWCLFVCLELLFSFRATFGYRSHVAVVFRVVVVEPHFVTLTKMWYEILFVVVDPSFNIGPYMWTWCNYLVEEPRCDGGSTPWW